MVAKLIPAQLQQFGLSELDSAEIAHKINHCYETLNAAHSWQKISTEILRPEQDFALHEFLYLHTYEDNAKHFTSPAWYPNKQTLQNANLTQLLSAHGCTTYAELHTWSHENFSQYWQTIVEKLNIQFQTPYESICNLDQGVEQPVWFAEATMNIADSCFQHADKNSPAIIYQDLSANMHTLSVQALDEQSNQIANALKTHGLQTGDVVAICMPMTVESIIAYLGIIKAGGVVASIAESYSAEEIATRLEIVNAKMIFTQDHIVRKNKQIPLYTRMLRANSPVTIVAAAEQNLSVTLRPVDHSWHDFIAEANKEFQPVACQPQSNMNILFSSGTTGTPKAIPWDHTTPIKSAADGFCHHDIKAFDVVAWPTSLGWMMGPWLVFASLLNRATIALYYGAPTERGFGEFVSNANVTMLGVVPSIVRQWRESNCMQGIDFSSVRVFSSTAESSNPSDMLFLMSLAGYKPVIEYCGGTEIGGGYITSTVIQPNIPAMFSCIAMGSNLVLLDDEQQPCDNGELALIPPCIGLSTQLLNRNHHDTYYANMPTINGKQLRRHGDHMEKLANGYFHALGRADDTMKLSGIKVSSIEIERAIEQLDIISECAAIAVPPLHGGPSQLVIYAVPMPDSDDDVQTLQNKMQKVVREELNPLFKIEQVVLIEKLPRTASNKIMRRTLRDEHHKRK